MGSAHNSSHRPARKRFGQQCKQPGQCPSPMSSLARPSAAPQSARRVATNAGTQPPMACPFVAYTVQESPRRSSGVRITGSTGTVVKPERLKPNAAKNLPSCGSLRHYHSGWVSPAGPGGAGGSLVQTRLTDNHSGRGRETAVQTRACGDLGFPFARRCDSHFGWSASY
jgi:hypothetical protein